MEYRDEPGFGRVAVATKAYSPGDVVIKEDALLEMPPYDESHPHRATLEKYASEHGVEPIVVLKLDAFLNAPADTQQKVAQLFCPDTNLKDHPLISQCTQVINTLFTHPPYPAFSEKSQQHSEADLTRILLVWLVNGHAFFNGSALFEVGSKLTHTCGQPNTAYRTFGTTTHQATHFATRPISPGEILTTNYLGWDHHALQSVPSLQHTLYSKYAFTCKCAHCTTSIDPLRAIPCPECSTPHRTPDRLLTPDAALHPSTTPPMGYLLCDQSKRIANDPTPWECDTCRTKFPDTLEALWGKHYHRGFRTVESTLERFASRLDFCLDQDPYAGQLDKTWSRFVDVARVLGPRHWATIRMMFSTLRVLTVEVEAISEQHLGLLAAGRAEGLSADFRQEADKLAAQLVQICDLLWEVLDRHVDYVDAPVMLARYFTAAARSLSSLAGCGFLGQEQAAALSEQALRLLALVAAGAVGPSSGVGEEDGRRGEVVELIRRMQKAGLEGIEEGEEEEGEGEQEAGSVAAEAAAE